MLAVALRLPLLIERCNTNQFTDNEECIEVCAGAPNAASAAQALVRAATQRWRGVDPSYIDDITAVCARLRRV